MIDFRYHVVSLVSVFLALAVGIVLGAGPLKEGLGVELNKEVNNLRGQLSDQNDELNTVRHALDNRDAFTRTVTPQLVAQQLAGQRVVLLTVPGVDTDAVGPLTDALHAAGATVSGRVDLRAAWTDPARTADRDSLARTLEAAASASASASAASASAASASAASASASAAAAASSLAAPAPGAAAAPGRLLRPTGGTFANAGAAATTAGGATSTPSVNGATGTDSVLAGLLASVLVTRDPQVAGHADRGAGALLDAFGKAGLVGVEGDPTMRADQAVLLVPAVPAAAGGAASPTPAVDTVAQWSAVAVALDGAGRGAVVTGPASSGTSGGVVAAIRGQDPLWHAVSTVDTGGTPMGDLTTVLALHEQGAGGSGRYGFVGSVDGPMPRLGSGRS